MTIDWRFAGLLLLLTFINFYAGYIIVKYQAKAVKKLSVTVAVSLSLAIIFYFKYANFFIESFTNLFHFSFVERETPLLDIVLPIGISFMTFQAITYPLDLYSKKLAHRASLQDFSLFMAFFPQLLSGPIVRASYFMPQLENNDGFSGKNLAQGVVLILRGLVKKIIIADILAIQIVDPAFSDPDGYSSLFLLTAIIAFSFQVYMDLSGYTDIAIGIGKMLGYQLPVNFNRPYLATSIANYWQRWHISMSSFFRDYLFEAISSWRWCNIYGKLIIVFMSIGLWHGAGWNFILYGLIHGSLVGFEQYQKNRRSKLGLPPVVYRRFKLFIKILQVFIIVAMTRVLFRGDSLENSAHYITSIFTSQVTIFPLSWLAGTALFCAIALHFSPVRWRDEFDRRFISLPVFVSAGFTTVLIYVLTALGVGSAGFIYFQF